MSYPTQFPEWITLAARDGRGGLSAEPPAISRGRASAVVLSLNTHPDYGNWTGGTFAAVARSSTDAVGPALLTFACETGTPAGGVTPVTMSIGAGDQGAVPADADGDGVTELLFEVTYTPPAGSADTILSSRILVVGVV